MTSQHEVQTRLRYVFGDRVRACVSLADFTTFRTGGPADWLLETHRAEDVVYAVRLTRELGLPLTLLGGGSNVLVGDDGVRGLVLRLRHGGVAISGPNRVRADAGVTINGLVRWLIQRGLSGLEAWAGTPGTVGGAVYGNAHFDGRRLGDTVTTVQLVSRDGATTEVSRSAMGFGYDESRIQQTGELVLSAEFQVGEHDRAALRAAACASLDYRKRTQPLGHASAGCIFQNPRPDDGWLPDDVPRSAGALIDRAGLKGRRVGGAIVSSVHGNFIVNEGGATARHIRRLIDDCRLTVVERFGVVLRDEVVCVGSLDDGGK